jgi:hypothetical protein
MEFLKTCSTNAQAIVRDRAPHMPCLLTRCREITKPSPTKPSPLHATPNPHPHNLATGARPRTCAPPRQSCGATAILLRRMLRDRGYGTFSRPLSTRSARTPSICPYSRAIACSVGDFFLNHRNTLTLCRRTSGLHESLRNGPPAHASWQSPHILAPRDVLERGTTQGLTTNSRPQQRLCS